MTVTDHRTASVRRALAATLILGGSAALLAGCAGRDFTTTRDSAATAPDSATQVAALRDSLIRIGREDQAGRDSTAIAFANRDTIFLARLMRGDSARTRWLEGTIAAHGWPRRSVVGDSAADAAWLVVQHSPVLAFQERMLGMLEGEVRRGEVGAADVAMLDDRVRTSRGAPQRFGSQFDMQGDRLVAKPIADLGALDSLRASVGLPPMGEYVKVLAELYKVRVEWPPRGTAVGR